MEYGEIANANLATLCEEALENSGSYVELCARLMEQAPICPVIFKSYAANVTRGVITNMVPAVDFVFHETENARTLADADKTYEPEMPDPTQETVEESASEGTEADTP